MEVEDIRKNYMLNFTDEKYQKFLKDINDELPTPVGFRLAESPLFVKDEFRDILIAAGDHIINFILRSDFKQITEQAIPDKWRCPNENTHPHIITMDFGIWKDENENLVPRLIELQGFPSLHALAAFLDDNYRTNFNIPDNWSVFFNGIDKTRYINLLKEIIIGPYQPDEVILMDVKPHEQHTAVDFYLTQKYLGIPIVALNDLKQEGKKLFYEQKGERKFIKRIYNRLIFDEVDDDANIFKDNIDIRQDLDVEWITHPNWFYRISKYLLPILKGDCVLNTYYLNDIIDNLPSDLQNYVLKPLFSFGGSGIIIDVKKSDIEKIKDPKNWILERKIEYEPILNVNGTPIKGEIRLMYLWPDSSEKPILTSNVLRLSTGKMINSQLNKNSEWAGSSMAFFQKPT
ncbi:unnamed protein product [Adineta steineri]|uniref:Uncharacterized protein n=2 Tax=Adineta steineri TaxID=433720 RepID=A0A815PBC4_9BILA|nr:unnamed protein product [Adineta steineri]CAF4017421.1 unnamed protein product [Adineta steineri]